MAVSLLAVAKHAVKHALPEVDPTQPAKLIPLRAAANNLSRCVGQFRAFAAIQQPSSGHDAESRSITLAHSSRSNVKGSIESTRRAGLQAASTPSKDIVRITPASTSGSRGDA